MAKQHRASTIINDPLDSIMPDYSSSEFAVQAVEPAKVDVRTEEPVLKSIATKVDHSPPKPELRVVKKKEKLSLEIEPDLANRIKNAVYWNPRLTVTKVAEEALRKAIVKIEQEHGKPYPQRDSDLKPGSRVR